MITSLDGESSKSRSRLRSLGVMFSDEFPKLLASGLGITKSVRKGCLALHSENFVFALAIGEPPKFVWCASKEDRLDLGYSGD